MGKFLSKRYLDMTPYVAGEQPQDRSYIKLNTNESPFPPSPKVIERLSREEVARLNLYSDPCAKVLTDAIVKRYNNWFVEKGTSFEVSAENVIVGNGSDEILAFIFQAFCDGEKGMAFPEIGYGFYPVLCDLYCIDGKKVELRKDFSIDVTRFKGLTQNITIANPNAQTGLYISIADIKTLLSDNKNRLVIIDEAYCDFGGESAAVLLKDFDNLIIVHTMSKSRQLAGGRIGFALASKEITSDLQKIRNSFNPYNLNRLSIIAGAEAIADEEYFKTTTEAVACERERFKERLKTLGFNVTDSFANFVLASKEGIGGKQLYLALKEKGVLVRFLSDEKLKDWVRITIGSKEQMDVLLEKIKEIIEEKR